jgi:hypothetical protein
MVWSQLTKELLSILSGFSEVSKLHHPERLLRLYIVYAPSLFSMAWALISVFVPEGTRDKIRILSSSQVDKDPYLQRWMGAVEGSRHRKTD